MPSHLAERCVLGLASVQNAASAGEALDAFAAWVGARAGVALSTRVLDGYAQLAAALRSGMLQLAWLPPVVFAALDGAVEPLVANHRGGEAAFHSVLIVEAESRIHTLDGLRGARVAWVDPLSASGYVLPRMQMAALGVDPRSAFAEERFVGSHDAVVRAVIGGRADVAGTFARVDGAGHVTRGAWSEVPEARSRVRVLATFGSIPADAIAARADLDGDLRARLAGAFAAASHDPSTAPLVRRLFGVEEFRRGSMRSYASLQRAIATAATRGLLPALPPIF